MTEQEAMEVLKQPCLCDYDLSNTVLDCDIKQCDKRDAVLQAIKALEEICQYREIGTPEECRSAMKKQTAKKPIRNDKCTCPSCGTHNEVFKKRRNTVYSDIVYCWHCGQALKIFRSDEE